MRMEQEMTMTYSAVVGKDKKKTVCVRFERQSEQGTDYAEGILPDCEIRSQKGFSADELEQLMDYLKANRSEIITKAKGLNNLMSWFK